MPVLVLLDVGMRQVLLPVRRLRAVRTVMPAAILAAVLLTLTTRVESQTAGPICRTPVVVSRLPRGAKVDSNWVNVAHGVQVARVLNRRDLWAGAAAWFRLDSNPGRVLSYGELDSLGNLGLLGDSAKLSQVRYLFPIHAGGLDEAKSRVRSSAPSRPPRKAERALLNAPL